MHLLLILCNVEAIMLMHSECLSVPGVTWEEEEVRKVMRVRRTRKEGMDEEEGEEKNEESR